MKISIIGTVVYDTVFPAEGEIHHGFGGITFNVLALGKLLKESNVEICPVTPIGNDKYNAFLRLIEKYPEIKIDGVFPIYKFTPHSQLTYFSANDREERLTFRNPPLSYGHIKPFADSDIILINFITGEDISLKNLKSLRRDSNALFYIDLHCLTMKRDNEGRKIYRRRLNGWEKWLENGDIIQMNFREFKTLFADNISVDSLPEYVEIILNVGVKIVVVTLGEKGVFLGFREKDGSIAFHTIDSIHKETAIDPTGCGDVFSAAFIVKYFGSSDPRQSAMFANKISSQNAQYNGIEWFLANEENVNV